MVLYTIGHSTHPIGDFIALLRKHGVEVVCDVRSSPYSRYNPQYNRENLVPELKSAGMKYVFLGKELGPRSDQPSCYVNGKVSYRRLAETTAFAAGLKRLREGMRRYHVALLCAEKDPMTCHRTILICRQIRNESDIRHILDDGEIERQPDLETRLLRAHNLHQGDLFSSPEERMERAYDAQAKKIAYVAKPAADEAELAAGGAQ
ncbi:MAG: DUF488 family protein [Desulfococcaceae bacterium]